MLWITWPINHVSRISFKCLVLLPFIDMQLIALIKALACLLLMSVQAPLDFDDPRIAWSRNNQGVLQEKDQAEAAGKQELLDKVGWGLL